MSRRRSLVRGPRRGMFWIDHFVNQTLASGGAFQDGLDGAIDPDEKKGLTLTRMIIDLTANLTAAGAGGTLSLGIYVCEQDAFAAGAISDCGDENEQPGWAWRAHRPIYSSNVNDHSQASLIQADVSSQRKYPGEDYSLILVGELPASANSVNLDGMIRQLYKRA